MEMGFTKVSMSKELNPYESPKVAGDVVDVKGQELQTVRPMVNTKLIGGLCRLILTSIAVLCLLLCIWNLKLARDYDITDEYEGLAFLNFDQMALLTNSYLYLFFGAAICVAFWKFKSMQNAWAMLKSGVKPTVSPGWAVAWYIIPIVSLWKPFTAMSEINQNSTEDPIKLKYWLGFWWFFWIVGTLMTRLEGVVSSEDEYMDIYDLQFAGANILIIGMAAVCLERIIAHITKEQMTELDKRAMVKNF